MTEPIGIFGGTFDPIHYGHLRTAFELLQALKLSQVRFLPTGNPPHREDALAPSALRLEMVRAAVAGQAGFSVDDREIRRSGVSYSIDTLTDLRGEFPQRSLCLLLGMDAFLGMPTWHRWREIFELAHVVVAHRPGWKAPITGPLGEEMVDRGTGSVRDLHASIAGRIHVHAVTQLEIASTDLRALILSGRDLRYLVPDAVRDLIVRTGCYAPSGR
jgi:nicotinate-nucleotide adenylyltransferase